MNSSFVGSDRFEVRRRLGAGGFGIVYQAFDRQRGQRVAIKTLANLDPSALYRFKHEFRALADVTHPNLVALHELVSAGDTWFFTMELVHGVDFISYVRGANVSERTASEESIADSVGLVGGPSDAMVSQSDFPTFGTPTLEKEVAAAAAGAPPGGSHTLPSRSVQSPLVDLERLVPAFRQLVEGLLALHAAGILHRDIKPSNVLVTAEGIVKLLDFGLVTDIADGGGSSHLVSVAGTPWYMAPEIATSSRPGPPSDFYSVGVMLYEALTGQLPFAGDALDVLVSKRQFRPIPPREIVPDTPKHLDELCMDLLRRRPELRPPGRRILERMGVRQAEARSRSRSLETPLSHSHAGAGGAMVGRDGALGELLTALEEARSSGAVVVFVGGGSGIGKTALARQFLIDVAGRGDAVALTGRCYERESVPFKAVDSLVDALSRYLNHLPEAEAAALVPRDASALARVFPVLERVPAIADAPKRVSAVLDPQQVRLRAFAALRELLSRLADRHPLVLAIDDFQWGDADSAALLSDLVRPPDAPACLLLVCYRSEDAQTSEPLRLLLEELPTVGCGFRAMTLGALDPAEARALARQLLADGPPVPDSVIDTIAAESEGNPFLIQELARYLLFEAADGASYTGGVGLDQMIRSRFDELPEPSRRLLEVVTIAARPIAQELAGRAAGLSPEERAKALAILRTTRFVRTSGREAGDAVEPYHNRVRETVLSFLTPEALGARNLELARVLEESGEADPETLAMLYFAADVPAKAASYAEAAAHEAEALLAFDHAAQLFQLTLDLAPEGIDRTRVKICLADALANAGRGSKAARAYLDASREATGLTAIDLRRRAADQLLRSGHFDEGIDAVGDVLRELGERLPGRPRFPLLALLLGRLRVWLTREGRASEADLPREDIVRLDTCWTASSALSMVDTVRGAVFQARHLVLARRAGEPYRLARALTVEAGYLAAFGTRTWRWTRTVVAQTEYLARSTGNPHAIGLAAFAEGISAFLIGEFPRGAEHLSRAEEIFREQCVGATWELDSTQRYLLGSLFYTGEIADVRRRITGLLREAHDRGDVYALASLRGGFNVTAWLADGDVARARVELAEASRVWSRSGYHLQHYYLLFAASLVDLYAGEGAHAAERMEADWPRFRRSALLRIQRLRIESTYMRAQCALAAVASGRPEGEAVRLAERAARALEGERLRWARALATALRATAYATEGRTSEAIAWYDDAAAMFERARMLPYAMAARHRSGELRGGVDGASMVERADDWFRSERVVDPARFAGMLLPSGDRRQSEGDRR